MKIKNRISVALDPQDIADYKAAQATRKRLAHKWLKNADIDEVKPGNYMGTEGGWRYCQDGYEFATKLPKIYDDEELDYSEYGKDINTATFLIEDKAEDAEIDTLMNAAFTLVGKDLMEQTHYIRKRGNDKRGKNLEYVAPSDKLNLLFEKRNEKAEETKKANDELNSLKTQLATFKADTK
jgi:hypothetical protein